MWFCQYKTGNSLSTHIQSAMEPPSPKRQKTDAKLVEEFGTELAEIRSIAEQYLDGIKLNVATPDYIPLAIARYSDRSLKHDRYFYLIDGELRFRPGALLCYVINASQFYTIDDLKQIFEEWRSHYLICSCTHSAGSCHGMQGEHFHVLTLNPWAPAYKQRAIDTLIQKWPNDKVPKILCQTNRCEATPRGGMVLYLKAGAEDPRVNRRCKDDVMTNSHCFAIAWMQAGPPHRSLEDEHRKKHPACMWIREVKTTQDALEYLDSITNTRIKCDAIKHLVEQIGPFYPFELQEKSAISGNCIRTIQSWNPRMKEVFVQCVDEMIKKSEEVHWSELFESYRKYLPHKSFIPPDTTEEILGRIISDNVDLADFCTAVVSMLDKDFPCKYTSKHNCIFLHGVSNTGNL